METRRRSDLITPVPKPRKRRQGKGQKEFVLGGADGLSTAEQEYNPTPIINEIRGYVETWRNLPNPDQWQVTPETSRLLKHWRHHPFQGLRPFFCQIEAVETAIWLAEVAPKMGARGAKFWEHLKGANEQSNPELLRIALKLATGAGKTTVMAMVIAWQAVNAARYSTSNKQTGSNSAAARDLRRRWPVGPAAHPRILAIVRKYYLACDRLNKEIRSNRSIGIEVIKTYVPDVAGTEPDVDHELDQPINPVVLVGKSLFAEGTRDLADIIGKLTYWPIGMNDKGDSL